MFLKKPTQLLIVALAIVQTAAASVSTDKIKQIRLILLESKIELEATLRAKTAEDAKLPIDNILKKMESCKVMSTDIRNEIIVSKEKQARSNNAAAVQQYADLESDFLELETERNRLARKISDTKQDEDAEEFGQWVKWQRREHPRLRIIHI